MDTNKNSYTIIYATILVVLVAAVLAFVSSSLKDKQQKNIDMEKQMSLLSSVGLAADANNVPDKMTYIAQEYAKYITKSFIVNYKGEIVDGDAFKVDLKSQYDVMRQIAIASDDKKEALKGELKLPVFVCTLDNGKTVYIFSCYGAGLWGPIWGYIGTEDNFDTIYGAVFSHKSETPGLGAEIATPRFSEQFKGKQLFDNNTFTSVAIVKGGATPGNTHQVDAISGGTITSKALDETIKQWLGYYLPYIKKQQEERARTLAPATEPVTEENTVINQ